MVSGRRNERTGPARDCNLHLWDQTAMQAEGGECNANALYLWSDLHMSHLATRKIESMAGSSLREQVYFFELSESKHSRGQLC
jgi:hypothetical protein